MVRILEKLGHTVVCPEGPACCGQPAFNTGYWDESRAVAIKVLESLKDAEVVVIASGSCGAMMKVFYPELFAGTTYEALARELAPKCYEFSAFLVNKLGVTDLGARFPHKVTFHDGCHGLRELKNKQPAARAARESAGAWNWSRWARRKPAADSAARSRPSSPMISTAMGEVKCASAAGDRAPNTSSRTIRAA